MTLLISTSESTSEFNRTFRFVPDLASTQIYSLAMTTMLLSLGPPCLNSHSNCHRSHPHPHPHPHTYPSHPRSRRAQSCALCQNAKAILRRPKTGQQICKDCFFRGFETEVHNTITEARLFKPGDHVAIGESGGKGMSCSFSVTIYAKLPE